MLAGEEALSLDAMNAGGIDGHEFLIMAEMTARRLGRAVDCGTGTVDSSTHELC